jgi:acyl-coenzyme A synthetase/AMP-(fatty) acid ligase
LCAEYTAGITISEQAYRAFLADRLQPHKIPRIIKLVDFLPKSRTGKLIRRA